MGVLYARVGGAWVPVVGPDEVWVGTDAPTDPSIELWIDTDDPGLPGGPLTPGGTTGQVLAKKSATDFDAEWKSTVADYRGVSIGALGITNAGMTTIATIDFGTSTVSRHLQVCGSILGSSPSAAVIRMLLAINGATGKQVQRNIAANASDSIEMNEVWVYGAGPLLVELKAQNFATGTFTITADGSFSHLNAITRPSF